MESLIQMIYIKPKTKTPLASIRWSMVGKNGGGGPVKRPVLAQKRRQGLGLRQQQWKWRNGQMQGYTFSRNKGLWTRHRDDDF